MFLRFSLLLPLILSLASCAQAEHVDCRYILNHEQSDKSGTCVVTGEVFWLSDIDNVFVVSAGVRCGVNPVKMTWFENGDIVSIRGAYSKREKPFLFPSDLQQATQLKSTED